MTKPALTLPYELLAEHDAKERMEEVYRKYGTDPRVIVANLAIILHEAVHDAIELGFGLADMNTPDEVLTAYNAGIEQGKKEAQA